MRVKNVLLTIRYFRNADECFGKGTIKRETEGKKKTIILLFLFSNLSTSEAKTDR